MARHIKQLKEFSQNKELVLFVGSSIKQSSSHTGFMEKLLSALRSSWDILELYLSEVRERGLSTEAFYRVFYEYFADEVFAPLQSFKYEKPDPYYQTIAQIVADQKLLALGTVDIDNRLALALKQEYHDIPFEQHADTNIPYVSYLNGYINDEDSLVATLEQESHKLQGASPNLEKAYHFITKNENAKAVLLLGLHPDDFCWKKTYGFMVQLAKKYPQKTIYWMYNEKTMALQHLKQLGNVHLIPYTPDILAEVFDLQHVQETVSELDTTALDKWLESKNADTDILEFAGALLNEVISRSHSLQVLEYAMSSYQSEGSARGLARVHRLKGSIYFEQGHLEKSIHNHNEAITLWSRSNNEYQLAKENILLADTYWNAGATDRAVQHYGEALSIYNMLENISGISSVTDKLARICDIDEDYELAQRYYNESLEAKKKKHRYSEMVQTLLNLSASLIKNQDWEQATTNLNEALRIGDGYYCHSSLEEVHQHLGLIAMSALDYKRAYDHYQTSYGIYQTQKDILSSVFVNCNLGHICAKLENYDESVKYYEGALESYEKMGDWQHLAAIYNNLGYINTCRKECGLAEEYFSRSVEIFVALGDVMNLIRTHGNLARVYTMQGEFENAIECYLANVEMLSQLDEKVELASTLIAISIVQAQSDQKAASQKSINEAIEIYQSLGMEKETKEAQEILQNLCANQISESTMPWVRKKFKKCKVYVLVDAQGQIVIENNLAQIKYRGVDDDKIYNARAEDIEDLENASTQQSPNTEKNAASTKTSKKKSDVKKDTPIQNTPSTSKQQNPTSSQVEIYTDGACTGNPGPAGIGIYFRFGKHHKEISEYIGHATNNIAELTAIKKALESLKSHEYPVTIFSDSQYSLSVLNGAYKAKKNKELIESIQKLMSNFKHLKLVKVAGHSGIAGNEKADRLAVSAIENAKNG